MTDPAAAPLEGADRALIAYALALTARRRGQLLDAFTVRKQPKDHGTGQRIEGCFSSGFPVVIVEDVTTTGGSAGAGAGRCPRARHSRT